MQKFSLRYKLVLPFVLIMLLVPAGIGWMLYDAGTVAVNALARRVLLDVLQQANASTTQHLTTARQVLNAFVPDADDNVPQAPFSDDMNGLEKRAWSTAKLLSLPGNYVYFGGADGRFFGLYRINEYLLEMYRRPPHALQRDVYALKQQGDRPALLRHDRYDPRTRPWYATALAQNRMTWSPVYNDFTSRKLTVTVAKPVRNTHEKIIGVAATDVDLGNLTDKLTSLAISRNGIAFVMDHEGHVIASSDQQNSGNGQAGATTLGHASQTSHPLIRASYQAILKWKNSASATGEPLVMAQPDGSDVLNIAATPVGSQQGVDWVIAVVAPRSDFMGDITGSFNRSLIIAGVCVVGALLLGLLMLNRVLRDIDALNDAARKIGLGENFPPLHIDRHDELGQLAQTFREMEHNLRTDKLTGAFNREYLSNRIRQMHELSLNPASPKRHFALLFIDLDDFKIINDVHGHDAGDAVLIEIARRLKTAVRATDIVTRYGGDEFVVLLNDMENPELLTLAEQKIRGIVEAPIAVNEEEIRTGFSIGWAIFPDDGTNVEKLLKIADARMFGEKKSRKTVR